LPGLDHFDESPYGGLPCRDMSLACPRIRNSDDRPRERKEVLERREEVSPGSLVPVRPQLEYNQVLHRERLTMGCCAFGSIQCKPNRPPPILVSDMEAAVCQGQSDNYRLEIIFPTSRINQVKIGHRKGSGGRQQGGLGMSLFL
jgi:hypothetical protein